MDRRSLGQTLGELAEAAFGATLDRAVRVQSLELALPLDVRLEPAAEPVLVADVPLWRWRTAFDPPPSRLLVVWEERPW